jgi:hypothetical protein
MKRAKSPTPPGDGVVLPAPSNKNSRPLTKTVTMLGSGATKFEHWGHPPERTDDLTGDAEELAGLERLMKGMGPRYLVAARSWFLSQGLTAVYSVKEAGAEEELIRDLHIDGKVAGDLLRVRLEALVSDDRD